MEIEQAMKILHPDTTIQALAEIAYFAGFNQSAKIEACDEACDEACVAVCDEIEKLKAENTSLRDLLKLAVEDLKEQSKYFGHCHYCTISNEHGGCKLGKSIKASVCNVWQWQHADKLEKLGIEVQQ